MKRTIALLSLLAVTSSLWAGGDILWLLHPNWDDVNDLSQYLRGLESEGYYILTEEDTPEEIEAFHVNELTLSMGSLNPDDEMLVDEIIPESDEEGGDIVLLDFAMNAFNREFWSQHLAAIQQLMEGDLGWDPSMFRSWLIRMIEREDVGQHLQVFVLYYLQLMQHYIDQERFPDEYASFCRAVQHVVVYDLRRPGADERIFYQRANAALSCLVELLAQRIASPVASQAFRAYANKLNRAFFTNVCPNKRGRGRLNIMPPGLMSLEGLKDHFVKIFHVLELALDDPFPCMDVLQKEYDSLNEQKEEALELFGELFLHVRRAQLARCLAILRQMGIIVTEEGRKNEGIECIALACMRERTRVDESKTLLRIACAQTSGKIRNKEVARQRRIAINQRNQTREEQIFREMKTASEKHIFQMNYAAGAHWRHAERLIAGPGGGGSDEETETLSDASTIPCDDVEEDICTTSAALEVDKDFPPQKRRKSTHPEGDYPDNPKDDQDLMEG